MRQTQSLYLNIFRNSEGQMRYFANWWEWISWVLGWTNS